MKDSTALSGDNGRTHGVRLGGVVAVAVGVAALGGGYLPSFDEVLPDKKIEYKKSESLPDLEVPPDLSSDAIKDTMAVPDMEGGAATYSTYRERLAARHREGAGAGVAEPPSASAAVPTPGSTAAPLAAAGGDSDGSLTVRGTTAELWPKLQSFWKDNGLTLTEDDVKSGRMATGWLENEREMTREKFELQLGAGPSGTTTVRLRQFAEAQKPEGERLTWAPTPATGVSGWLNKLEATIGGAPVSRVSAEERAAQRSERDRETSAEPIAPGVSEILYAGEGKKYLLLGAAFADAWHDTGAALEKAGIEVEDKDESRGVYYIHYLPETVAKPGFWSRLAFWRGGAKEAKHQVSITAVGRKSEIVVLDHKGNWENNRVADSILESVQSQLKQLQSH